MAQLTKKELYIDMSKNPKHILACSLDLSVGTFVYDKMADVPDLLFLFVRDPEIVLSLLVPNGLKPVSTDLVHGVQSKRGQRINTFELTLPQADRERLAKKRFSSFAFVSRVSLVYHLYHVRAANRLMYDDRPMRRVKLLLYLPVVRPHDVDIVQCGVSHIVTDFGARRKNIDIRFQVTFSPAMESALRGNYREFLR